MLEDGLGARRLLDRLDPELLANVMLTSARPWLLRVTKPAGAMYMAKMKNLRDDRGNMVGYRLNSRRPMTSWPHLLREKMRWVTKYPTILYYPAEKSNLASVINLA